MNAELKNLMSKLRIDGNLRARLNKIFNTEDPVTSIDFRGYEHNKKLQVKKEDLQTVLTICQAIPTLESLTILGDELDDKDAPALGEAIAQMNQLNSFNIDSSNIGDAGAAAFTASAGVAGFAASTDFAGSAGVAGFAGSTHSAAFGFFGDTSDAAVFSTSVFTAVVFSTIFASSA